MRRHMTKRELRKARMIAKDWTAYGSLPKEAVQKLVNSGTINTAFIEDMPVERVWLLAGLNPVVIRQYGIRV